MDKSIALYLFVSFVACVTPGSGVLYTIASGFRGGMKCVLASPLGTCLGCSLMSALSATGLGALIANSPAAYNVLQVVSALVLVWFGFQSWRTGALDLSDAGNSAAREGLRSGQERFTFRKIFWGAVVLQASNIMLIVFLLSLMPPFIRTDQAYLPQAVMLSALFVLVCFVVHLGYSWIAAAGAKRLAGPKFSFWLNRISAVLFWLLAVSVIWNAFFKS